MLDVSPHKYHQDRNWLIGLWNQDIVWFSYLTQSEQYALHDYFQLTKTLSPEELLAHRQAISEQRPSLPQQAGKAASKLDRLITHGPQVEDRRRSATTYTSTDKRGKQRTLSVRSVMRPEPDYRMLARAIVALAWQQATEQAAASQDQHK